MPGAIHLRDVLRLMHEAGPGGGAPKPFSLTYYTWNRTLKKGGSIKVMSEAVVHTEASQANPRPYTERHASVAQKANDPKQRHKPGDHWRNATRNIRLPNGDIRKVIIWLITEFNGQRVVL